MAKKIINTEEQDGQVEVEPAKKTDEKKEEKTIEPAEKSTDEIPKHILDILKKNPRYASLYVDSPGGCFTEDTPANIRGNAVLYKNPFHNQ